MLTTSDRAAFQQLARDEQAGLYALARRLTGRDAEDLVQEALLRACRSFASLREPRAGGQWLRVILINVWRDRLRKRSREPTEVSLDDDAEGFSLYRTLVDEDTFPYSNTLHLDFLGGFSEDDIHIVLQRLPARYRAPLVLRYMEGFPTKQIARLLELPPQEAGPDGGVATAPASRQRSIEGTATDRSRVHGRILAPDGLPWRPARRHRCSQHR